MSVKVIMPVFLQAFTESEEMIEVNGATVGDCLGALTKRHPGVRKMLVDDTGKLLSYVGVYINGQNAFPNEMSRPVKDGDEIHVLYALGGG